MSFRKIFDGDFRKNLVQRLVLVIILTGVAIFYWIVLRFFWRCIGKINENVILLMLGFTLIPWLALVLKSIGFGNGSVEFYEASKKKANYSSLSLRGDMYRLKGQFVDAEYSYQNALHENSNNPWAYLGLAELYSDQLVACKDDIARKDYYTKAIESVESAFKMEINLGAVYYIKALVLIRMYGVSDKEHVDGVRDCVSRSIGLDREMERFFKSRDEFKDIMRGVKYN